MPFANSSNSNVARAQLDAGLLASGTAVTLPAGKGALFPSTFPFWASIESYDDVFKERVTKREIVKVTNKIGDVLTVVRSAGYCPATWDASAQTNTAFSFSSGDFFAQVFPAEQVEEIQDEVARLETDKLDKVGTLRTGLTGKRIIITDGAGAETYLAGTVGQVVGFDADGDPVVVVPTVDIPSLPASSTISDLDSFVKRDDSSAENQELTFAQLYAEILSRTLAETVPFVASGTTTWAGTITFTHGLWRIPRKIRVEARCVDRQYDLTLLSSDWVYNGTSYATVYVDYVFDGISSYYMSQWSSSAALAVISKAKNGVSNSIWTVTTFSNTEVVLSKTVSTAWNADIGTISYSVEIA